MGRPKIHSDDDPKVVANRTRAAAWQRENREAYNARRKRWKQAHREHANKYERDRRARRRSENPARVSLANRAGTLRRYGLTPAAWDQLFETQYRRCAICGTDDSSGRWHTDHDNDIGMHAVRGILCVRCNIGLGQFKHDPAILAAAIAYLRAAAERQKENDDGSQGNT